MFVKDYPAARIPFGDGTEPPVMRRLRLGQGTDLASQQAWVTQTYQQTLGRAPSAAELAEGVGILNYTGAPYLPSGWTVPTYYVNVLKQVKTGYLQPRGNGTWVKPSSGETISMPMGTAPAAATAAVVPPAPVTAAPSSGDQAQVTQLIVPASAVPVGVQFQVTASVLNAGPTTWGSGYTLQLAAPAGTPAQSSVAFATLPSGVAPGQQVDVVLTVWAPSVAGTYPYQYAVLNPSQQAISPTGTLSLSIVPASAVTPAGTVTADTSVPAGFVSREEFDAYVQAALQAQGNVQGTVSAMEQANVRGYQPTYTGLPGAPPPVPLPPSVVVQTGTETNWLAWGAGLLIAGGLAWYFSQGGPKKRTGATRTRVVKRTTTSGGA